MPSPVAAEIKKICIDKASEWLNELSEKRNSIEDQIDSFLSDDAR